MTDAGWTSNKPTEPGWYWFRDTHGNLTIVEIVQDGTVGLWVQWLTRKGHIHGGYIDNKFGEWLGPITPTDRQQGRVEAAKQNLERRTDECNEISKMYVEAQAELERVRGLVKALPKVEGEIEVSSGVYNFILLKHDSGTRFLCGQIETEQTAKAIAALWQHRQGMEG